MNLSALLLVLASVLFGLAGFGLVNGSEHFLLVPVGLLCVSLAFLLGDIALPGSRRIQ